MMQIGYNLKRAIDSVPWPLVLIIAFGIVFAFSFTPVYIHPDSAQSIFFHALGRDFNISYPYAPYTAGMDLFLSVLPPHEPLVRIMAALICALSAFLATILAFHLSIRLLGEKVTGNFKTTYYLLALIAMPELFYHILFYQTSSMALCFFCCSHLLIRKTLRSSTGPGFSVLSRILVAGLLFGAGVTFRWNMATYILFILADCLTMPEAPRRSKIAGLGAYFGLTVLSSFGFIIIVAAIVYHIYNPLEIIAVLGQTSGNLTDLISGVTGQGIIKYAIRSILNVSPLISPAALLLAIVGLFNLSQKPLRIVLLSVTSIMSVLPWAISGTPKFLTTFFPFLFMLIIFGSRKIFETGSAFQVYGTIALALIPWFIGIKYVEQNTLWGPGFEYRAFNSPRPKKPFPITLGAGSAYGTFEGPRPIGGHAYVLFGEWRKVALERENERHAIVDRAIKENLPILTMAYSHANLSNYCLALGYKCVGKSLTSKWNATVFKFQKGNDSLIITFRAWEDAGSSGIYRMVADLEHGKAIINGYERTMRFLGLDRPDLLTYSSKLSAIVDGAVLARH